MRKLKLFLMACTLMGAGTSWAQTDVTDTYITNAGFEDDDAASNLTGSQTAPSGWTLTSSSGTGNTQWGTANASTTIQGYATSFSPSEGSNYFYLRCNWQSGTTLSLAQTTTSELPAGVYIISFDAVTYSSNGTQPTYTFKVNDGTNDVVAGTMKSNKTSWTNYKFIFNLTSASTVTITAAMKPGAAASSKHDWMLLDNMRLLYFPSEEACNDYLIQQYNLTEATYATPVLTSFVVNGTFDNGISPWQCTGGFQNNKTANNQQGAFSGNFYENWNGSAKVNKMYQTINNIPNGTYRLDICAFVNNLATPAEGQSSQTSQYVFANDDKTYLTTGNPTAYEVYTVVTNNQIEIGLEQTTATANWMGIDNVSLRYYGAGDVINAAQNASHKLAWEEAKTAAEAAIANTDYANVTGKEQSDLQTEIGMAEPTTAQGYDDAAAALTAATQAFVNAKASYDIFAAYNKDLAYADASKKPAITGETTAAELIVALRAYYESHALAEGAEGAVNITTDKLTNATNPTNTNGWTITNTTGNSNMRIMSGEPYTNSDGSKATGYFDSNSWGSAFATTFTQDVVLPAGKYLLSAKARGNGTTTYQLIAGEEATDITAIGNTGGVFGSGWNDYSVEFELTTSSTVTLGMNLVTGSSGNWLSFGDFRLIQLEINTSALATDWTNKQDEANALLTNNDYDNITGVERSDLSSAINQNPSTDEQYTEAINALQEAMNVFTAAKDSYDAYVAAKAAAEGVNEADVLSVVIAGNAKATAADALAASIILAKAYDLIAATYTEPIVTNFVVNGTFDSNINGWSRLGDYFQNNQRQTGKDAPFSGGFYENWTPSADNMLNKMYQVIENIPNGTYRLDICAFVNNLADPNESQYVFANNDKTYLTAGNPTAYEVYTVVTNNQIEIGLEQTTSTANWMAIDNVSLRYYGAGDVINAAQNAAHKLAWEEAKTAAEAAIANTDYANVTGKEQSDLQTEIGMAEPTTAQGYDDAAAALTTATQAFIAAAPAYNAHVAEIAYANTINVSTTAASAALNAEATAATVVLATQDLKVLEYTTIKAAYANDVTDMLGTWEAGNYGTTSGQGYIGGETYFDKWNGGAMDLSSSKTVTLPAGAYTVMVAGRGVSTTTMNLSVKVGEADAVSVPFLMIGDTGKGIDVNGATNFSEEGTYSNNNIGRGWQYRYLPFILTAASEVTIAINGHLNGGTWQSFYAPVLLADNNTVLGISLAELAAAMTAAQDATSEVSTLLTTAAQAADPSAEAVTYQYVVGGSEAADLVAAVSAAGTVDNTDMAAVQAATAALTEATEAYNAAKPAYERALMVIGMAKVSETIVGTTIYNLTVKPKVDILKAKVANSETTAETIESEANNLMKSLMNYALLYKSKVMGFGVGEYAPYNNVEGLLLTEEAKQIGVAPENFTNQQIFDTFLALKDFDSWVVNTEDVDAIYNGNMAIANGTNPKGWTRSNNGWGQLREDANGTSNGTAWYYNNNGAWQYGNDGVYTMPLAAETQYVLTFKYRSHGTASNDQNRSMTVSVLKETEGLSDVVFPANATTEFVTATAYFTTGTAGNYILSIANNGNTWLSDVSLVKATSTTKALAESTSYTPELAYYENVELTRSIKGDDTWNTFVVPFDLSNEELKAAFGEDVAVAEYSETADGDNSTVYFNTMDTPAITANTPVLLKGNAGTSYTFSGKLLKTSEAKVEGTNFDFVGTYEATTTIAVGDYFIGGNKLWKSEGNTTIAGTRAYIKAKTTKAKVACFALDGGETTAINTVNGEGTKVNGYYNLNGQRVDNPKKGLYIVNGKKRMVK